MGLIRSILGSVAALGGLGVVLHAGTAPAHKPQDPPASVQLRFLTTMGYGPQAGMHPPQTSKFPKVDPKDEIPLPDGPGKDTTKKVCGNCHSTNIWIKQRHTQAKWSSIIDNMLSKGMEASEDDLGVVNDYLGTYLAPAAKDPATAMPPPPSTPQP